jgi:hypothetical protein
MASGKCEDLGSVMILGPFDRGHFELGHQYRINSSNKFDIVPMPNSDMQA